MRMHTTVHKIGIHKALAKIEASPDDLHLEWPGNAERHYFNFQCHWRAEQGEYVVSIANPCGHGRVAGIASHPYSHGIIDVLRAVSGDCDLWELMGRTADGESKPVFVVRP